MNKKKILTLCLVACLAITAIAGASLAYFTDTDSANNAFTAGNVKIKLNEDFDKEKAQAIVPVTGESTEATGYYRPNGVKKVVQVENTGNSSAYVRVHIAFPLDTMYYVDGEVKENLNLIHFNQRGASMHEGLWSWWKTLDGYTSCTDTAKGYPGNGTNQNTYVTEINGKQYLVFVATYMTPLAEGESTGNATDALKDTATAAIFQVYLDQRAFTFEQDGKTLYTRTAEGNETPLVADLSNFNVYVVAEGCQSEGFSDAYTALNKTFGVPGSYNIDWPTA